MSEGEFKASRALKEAADVLIQSPCAMQLRYLQTLSSIATEQNSTIIFPLPVDLFSLFQNMRPNTSSSSTNPFESVASLTPISPTTATTTTTVPTGASISTAI
jgi:hypothetical protein